MSYGIGPKARNRGQRAWQLLIETCKSGLNIAERIRMKLVQCLLLSLWMSTSMCLASQWYVSTNGSGNGSFGSPWLLQTALTNSTVQPGDTVWLRGGTYFPSSTVVSYNTTNVWWIIGISGTSNGLITFRSYSNEWASIDRALYLHTQSYIRFRDLEFYNSLKGHELTNNIYPAGPWTHFETGAGTGNEWINCVIHDVDNCMGGGNAIHGCIFWHVGVNGLEHVCYPAPASFVGNISAWHVNNVINQNPVAGTTIKSNIMFGAGQSVGGAWGGDIQASGGDCEISYNCFYNHYLTQKDSDRAMYLDSSPAGNVSISNNIVAEQTGISFTTAAFVSVAIKNNTFYMDRNSTIARPADAGAWTVNNNRYTSSTNGTVVFREYVTNFYNFDLWKANKPGFDTSSTATNGMFPPDAVIVIPNQDQPKRCHIAIYNFSRADNVTANLSGVLNAGDGYRLFSAQNYNAGAIQSGTFNGTNISVPMTNLTTAPILYGTNWGLTQPPPTSPEFGAFVVIGSQHVLAPPEKVWVLPSP
jgi:hypothetical protein